MDTGCVTKSAKCMKDLEEKPNSTSFGNLAKVTLTQIVQETGKGKGKFQKWISRLLHPRIIQS